MSNTSPFRLVDDFQAQYIKFAGRTPRTLEELAIALADNEHRNRLAEVKAMRARLAQLDELLPALAARGVKVWPSNIHGHDHGKTLRIYSGMFERNSDKLHAALLEVGFREVKRESGSAAFNTDTVTMQHGRWLVLVIDVSKAAAPAAEPQPAPIGA